MNISSLMIRFNLSSLNNELIENNRMNTIVFLAAQKEISHFGKLFVKSVSETAQTRMT
jgi:hypothetical protein